MSEKVTRANGPYEHGKRWRVKLTQSDGAIGYRYFETEREGKAYVAAFREETENRTLGHLISEYLHELATHGVKRDTPVKASTLRTIRHRLYAFFRVWNPELSMVARDAREEGRPEEAARIEAQALEDGYAGKHVSAINRVVVAKLYRDRVATGVRTSTHRGELNEARKLFDYAVSCEYLAGNPCEGIKMVGVVSEGKTVLRVDDARAFLSAALGEGSPEGLACSLLLVMGLRASELADRVVGDINVTPVLLTVPRGKTRAAKRTLAVPAPVDALLAAHVKGRRREEKLFELSRYALHYHVKRICKLADVPEVCPHGLRGSFATLVTESGGVETAARLLGHTSPEITRRHYVAPGAEESAAAARRMEILGPELGTRAARQFPIDPTEEVDLRN